jgi:hypothetical protein
MNAIIEILIERDALGTISSMFSLKLFDLQEFYLKTFKEWDASFPCVRLASSHGKPV